MSGIKSNAERYVTCGFFNSDGTETGVRKYSAEDFSKIFDGMITDGVFASIGDCLVVKASSENTVNIGTGKCWFNHTWTLNSNILPITCNPAHDNLDRIDAIVLEVNATQSVRDNSFKYIEGTASGNPSKPILENTELVHQHALCYINRPAGSTAITQANIENVVGTAETPFVTAILQTVSLDALLGQWQAQLDEFIAERQSEVNLFISANEAEYDKSIAAKEAAADSSIASKETEFNALMARKESDYNTWSSELMDQMETLLSEVRVWYSDTNALIDEYLTNMKGKLATDPAAALQIQIDEHEIRTILTNGFTDGSKTISDDGCIITSVNSSGWTLLQTFTNGFLTLTAVLKNSDDRELGRMVKNISSDGLRITSEITVF